MNELSVYKGLLVAMQSRIRSAAHISDNETAAFWLVESESRTLELIDLALERLEQGVFGICEICGVRIGEPRLHAIPYATTCSHCAEWWREGEHRDPACERRQHNPSPVMNDPIAE